MDHIVIEENGVRLRLNIVDTPGYGDQVNNENWYVIRAGIKMMSDMCMIVVGSRLSNTSRISILLICERN